MSYSRSLVATIFFSVAITLTLQGCASSRVTTLQPAPGVVPITYTLAPLPYAASALEPSIDTETMTIHHDKHHQTYVDNLNKAIKDTDYARIPLETLMRSASTLPAVVRNNAGGHWNHTFFWNVMAPAKNAGAPSPQLSQALITQFGSLDSFKEKFNAAATGRFGSGWAWLIKTPTGLAITSTSNQDNPLMDVAEVRGTPILTVDVWEHAYYLKYRNKRSDYLKSWWGVVNWREVSRLYDNS